MHFSEIVMNLSKIKKVANKFSGCKNHVALICDKRGRIVSVGINQSYKTHVLAKRYGYRYSAIHAELHAITTLSCRLNEIENKNYILINLRFLANKNLGLAKPCILCQRLLKDFGIKRVYYTNKSGNIIKL